MGDIGSAFSGAMGNIGGGLSDATSGLGGFGSALSGFGSALGALGGGGQSAGQAFGAGGVDPNTGQPIAQETPQTAQAQSQGPPTGTTPPGVDPATQIGGTQSGRDSNQGYASVLAQLAKNVQAQRQPTQLPGARPPDAPGTVVPDNQGGGAYTPSTQGGGYVDSEGNWVDTTGMPEAKQAGRLGQPARPVTPTPASAYGNYGPQPNRQGAIPVGGGAGNVQEAPSGRPSDPVADTGELGKQYGDFLQGQGAGRPVAGADVPAAGATPMSATGGGTGAGGVPGAAQGQGDGMQQLMSGLMQMFLPMLLGSLMGGGGGGMGVLLPMMMMGGMMGPRGFGNMMGGRRMMPGFGGGFLRAGYYPDGRGGFGFHPGGFHGGWRPHYIGAYGGPNAGRNWAAGRYGGGAFPGTPADMRGRAQQGMSYLTSKGLPPASAAAILGNAAQESSIRGGGLGGDQGTSGAMFQWRDPPGGGRRRFTEFANWARQNGKDIRDPQANFEYVVQDLQQNYPQLWATLQRGGDPAQLADLFERVYEVSKDPQVNPQGMRNREQWAREFAGMPAGSTTASEPATPAGPAKQVDLQGNPLYTASAQ